MNECVENGRVRRTGGSCARQAQAIHGMDTIVRAQRHESSLRQGEADRSKEHKKSAPHFTRLLFLSLLLHPAYFSLSTHLRVEEHISGAAFSITAAWLAPVVRTLASQQNKESIPVRRCVSFPPLSAVDCPLPPFRCCSQCSFSLFLSPVSIICASLQYG